MLFRYTSLWIAAGLVLGLWVLSATRESTAPAWVRPIGAPRGPVKILQFYANVGALAAGDKALLCYGVENARSVRISPVVEGVYPSPNRCLEIGPTHTTHYTILAEGFDGRVATQSFTLPVKVEPAAPNRNVNYAEM